MEGKISELIDNGISIPTFIMQCLITVCRPPMPGYNTQGYLPGNELQGPCIKEYLPIIT
jgi:hypothetical protein